MYPVSEKWKQACSQQIRQAQALAKIEIGIFDEKAPQQATFELPELLWECEDTLLSPMAKGGYAAFEPKFFRLDGKQLLMPLEHSQRISKKLISKEVSGQDGVFLTPPTIKICFSEEKSLVGITLSFGRIAEEAPETICLTGKTTAGTVEQWEIQNPNPVHQAEIFLESIVELQIIFKKTKAPFGRARLERVQFGIGYEYTGAEILELNEMKSISPASLELPRAEIDFTLNNHNGKFDADRNQNINKFLKQGQVVKLWYGMELGNEMEWIPAGKWYLESWSANQTARFTATDRLILLNKTTFEKGKYIWAWQKLYNVAKEILQDAGLKETEYRLDEGLKKVLTMAPIPIVSHATALQLIANRSKMNLFVDRDGKICLAPINETPVLLIDKHEVFERPTVKRNPVLKQVDGFWIWRSRYTVSKKVLLQTRMRGRDEWVRVEHDICLEPVIKTNPLTEVQAIHYARVSYLKAPQSTTEFDLELVGRKLAEVKYPIVVKKQKEGEILTIENPLFDNENSQQVFEWVKSMCGRELEYQMEIRGLPQLDIGDRIQLWNQKAGQIVESKFTFSGVFRQELKIWCEE